MFITSKHFYRKEKVVLTSGMTDLELVEINSFVRGFHDYFDIWDATVGEVLILRNSLTAVETFMQGRASCRSTTWLLP